MKKILYICELNPFQISSGGHQRTNLLCRALSEKNHVDIICFTTDDDLSNDSKIKNSSIIYLEKRPEETSNYILRLFQKLKRILCFFLPTLLVTKSDDYCLKKIREVLINNTYDYIVVRYLPTAIKFGLNFDKKLIIDLDDLPEQVFRSEMKLPCKNLFEKITRKPYYFMLSKAAKKHTNRLVKKVNHVFLPDEKQCLLFENASYLPNIPYPREKWIDEEHIMSSFNKEIMFVGKLSHTPNLFGVDYFIEKIWPIIITKIPSAHFNIIGSYMPFNMTEKWTKIKGVNVVGYVEELAAEYKKNSIIIAPLYHGAGTNIKVLEAMQMARACVVTKYACKGFENILQNEKNILISETDSEFAEKVITILLNDEYNLYIRKNAVEVIKQNFSYEKFCQLVQEQVS